MIEKNEDLPETITTGYLTPDGIEALVKAITNISDNPNIKSTNKLTEKEKDDLFNIIPETPSEPDQAIERKTVYLNPDSVSALIKVISNISNDPHIKSSDILNEKEKNDLLNIIPETPSEPDQAIERKTVYLNPDGVKALVKAISNISEDANAKSSKILNQNEINNLLNPE
ncbi:MAG: hypothetical protein OEV44_02750 [Spirochaetota bacterium]|nr:hypothetical protein [Spirochaetota bacterium]